MKKIVLAPNPGRDTGLSLTMKIKEVIENAGIAAPVCMFFENGPSDFDDLGVGNRPETQRLLSGADMIICLGGDGTILHLARQAAVFEVPVLGINLGTKGFLADLEREDFARITDVISGNYLIDERMMIDIQAERAGAPVFSGFALNEAVIGKDSPARPVKISVFGDERKITGISGDGLIIATPTGSTAYSMAAGGPIVEPSAENLILTPVCAHELSAKSFVLRADRRVMAEITDTGSKTARLSVDGASVLELDCGDIVKVTKSRFKTSLVRVIDKSFYDVVNRKLTRS